MARMVMGSMVSLSDGTISEPDIWRDWMRCDEARLRRDAAFDGLFFTCVRTTKIYCQPICPVAHAHSKNVFFVPTAAAAERLGFRPCLVLAPAKKPAKITALKFGQVVMRAHLSIDALSLKKAQAVIGGRFNV